MVWLVTGSVFISTLVMSLLGAKGSYNIGLKIFLVVASGISALNMHTLYRHVMTRTIYDTATVVYKREEEVERTELWVTIHHLLGMDDGREYWIPITPYNETEVGDTMEVKYTVYENEVIDWELKDKAIWLGGSNEH